MEKSQHIHCTVESCAYNKERKDCSLDAISVEPSCGGNCGEAQYECMCASYHKR